MKEQNIAASASGDAYVSEMRHPRCCRKGRIPQHRGMRCRKSEEPYAPKTRCKICGYEHTRDTCPAKGQKCRTCRKTGHFSHCCNLNKQQSGGKGSHHVPEVLTDTCWVYATGVENSEPWTVELDLTGDRHKTVFKIDTGADITILKQSDYQRLLHRPELYPSSIAYLKSPGGSVDTLGEFTANVTFTGQDFTFQVLVVPIYPSQT